MTPAPPSAFESSHLPATVCLPGDRVVLVAAQHLAGTVVANDPIGDRLTVRMDAPWKAPGKSRRAKTTPWEEGRYMGTAARTSFRRVSA